MRLQLFTMLKEDGEAHTTDAVKDITGLSPTTFKQFVEKKFRGRAITEVSLTFEELDYQPTPLGDISLRRRSEPKLDGELLYEVKLGDDFLMSSLFPEAEIQLSRLGLAGLEGSDFDVVVGGLGLGYTAVAVLENVLVRSLIVVELLAPVIDWHRRGLVPNGKALASDPRCALVHADFFALATSPKNGFDPTDPDRRVHAILLDIDHSPSHWLAGENSAFYAADGLRRVAEKLNPGGIFGLWSNDPPEDEFTGALTSVFQRADSHVVTFPNPYSGGESANTVFIARKGDGCT